MSETYAVRNIRLCTKDCLCLYVCPTGATDTENSIIDKATCIGCGVCAQACPSAAISMVPKAYPPQQLKQPQVVAAMLELVHSKCRQEAMAAVVEGNLGRALRMSNRILTEDLLRESGYMLPQGEQAKAMLRSLLASPPSPDFPAEAAQTLLKKL